MNGLSFILLFLVLCFNVLRYIYIYIYIYILYAACVQHFVPFLWFESAL